VLPVDGTPYRFNIITMNKEQFKLKPRNFNMLNLIMWSVADVYYVDKITLDDKLEPKRIIIILASENGVKDKEIIEKLKIEREYFDWVKRTSKKMIQENMKFKRNMLDCIEFINSK